MKAKVMPPLSTKIAMVRQQGKNPKIIEGVDSR